MSSQKSKSQISKRKARQTEKIVTRDRDTLEIKSVDFPNRVEFGLDNPHFNKGIQVYGNCSISGSVFILKDSGYFNFGTIAGTSGYGLRDNAGTIQFKNKTGLQSTWTNIGSGGSGTPGGSTTQVQFNDAGSFAGDSGFTYNKTSDTASVANLSASLTRLADNTSYLIAGTNIGIVSQSNGSVTISSSAPSLAVSSGSVSVSNVSTLAASDGIVVVNEGSGRAALSASIGVPEDGSYTDGLFIDFTPQTRLGVAIDRFNEVLKGLAPSAAPQLDDMDSNDTGENANLSFGSSQSIGGYINVQPSTLSSPSSNLSDVNINGTFSSSTVSNDIRSACFAGSTVIDGTLNEDVAADGSNYNADSFGNANQGTLKLFVNNNSNPVHTVDLSSFGSGNSLNGDGTGFNLTASTPGHFADGSNFETFQHRQGTYTIAAASQRNGWNYARVVHTIGSSDTTCNYVEWVNDSNSNALSAAGSAMDTLSMTGLFKLSGVRYNTGGSAEYRTRVSNAYRNVYSSNNITFTGTRCSASSQVFPSINFGGGENETKTLHITASATINTDPILNNTIGASVNVPHPLKSNLSTAGSQTISGILLYGLSNTSTVISETFRRENYRIASGSYNSQSDVTSNSNIWNSSKHMSASNAGHEDGLLFYNSRLYSPRQGGVTGDFRNTADGGSIVNGPSENVNYSGITSGRRTFYRYFQNNSGGAKTDFSLAIEGSGNIVSQGTALGTGNISVLAKLPTTGNNQVTGWMDLALAFSTGQTGNGDGCLNGSLDSSLNATNSATFGTVFADSNEYIVIKIEADASFTGYVSSIALTWL